METIILVCSIIVGVYEVIIRLIPTVKDYTFIGMIIKVLKVISDNLQLKKKK